MPIIRINLLPPEKRRRERTPLSRYVALILGTAVNAAIVLFMVKVALDTKSLNEQKTNVEGTIATTEQKVKGAAKDRPRDVVDKIRACKPATAPCGLCDYDKTKKQVDTIGARKGAIESLKKEKILSWSEVIDAICDVMAANQWVWLTGIDMGEGTRGPRGSIQLDMYLLLNCSSTASEEDCKRDRQNEVMTKFKRDIWDKFQVGPGALATGRKFPFDYADEQFPISRTDSDKYRETVKLDFTATVGHKMAAARPGVPGRPPGK